MSDQRKTHPAMRTFAADMEAARQAREPQPADDAASSPKTAPKASPSTAKPTPQEQSRPEPAPIPAKKPDDKKPAKPIPAHKPENQAKPHQESKAAAKRIPAFHELQKEVRAVQEHNREAARTERGSAKAAKKSKQAGTSKSHPLNIGYDSKVITDTKHRRFKLLPAMVQSVKDWFKRLTTKKKKQTPKYAVADTERRKGVIQKATSKTGTMFTADSETLREQIRRRQLAERQHDGETETSWSPYTEPGYKLLDAPDEAQNVSIEYKKSGGVTDTARTTAKATVPPPQIVTPSEPEPAAVDAASTPESAATTEQTPTPNEGQWAGAAETTSPPAAAESVTQKPAGAPEYQTTTPERRRGNARFIDQDTNTLTVVLLVAIVGFVAVLFVSRMLFTYITETATDDTPVVEMPTESVMAGAKLTPIILSVDRLQELPQLIATTSSNGPAGLVELPILSPAGDEVSPSYIFDLLDFDTIPTFRQSLTTARFVTVNRGETALILQFVDRDTVLGGFLQWEPDMAEDFAAFYDLPTPSEAAALTFVDETIKGIDVRVLRVEDRPVLVYGIIGDQTALVAGSSADFAQLIGLGLTD